MGIVVSAAVATGVLHTGTSGYRYWPGDVFPPKTSTDDALKLYAERLHSLELNRSFYQLPRASSVDKWLTLVPSDFSWAVKILRKISHEKKLVGIEADWELFLSRLRPLVVDNGVFLLQLSKTFPIEFERLENFLKLIPHDCRLAVEFRHNDWFTPKTYKLLEKYGVALVGVGAPGVPRVLDVQTAPFTYYRLHGPRAWYKDRYTEEELMPFVTAAQKALRQGDVYTYFDNTIGGHAWWNAQEFHNLVQPVNAA